MANKQHNFTPMERARNAGWQAAYHMVLIDMSWDDTEFKSTSVGKDKGLIEAYESAKRNYLAQQQ